MQNTMRKLLHYSPKEFIIRSFNKNIIGSMDEYFVTLEIVERDKNAVQESSWGFEFFSKRDIIPGRRSKSGIPIQVEDIMNYSLNKIAVYGSPGTGKTTFCKKIVYEFYQNEKMNDIFDDIIWIQLRQLREKSLKGEDFKTIDELVAEYLGITKVKLNFEKCLFILDGWEEIHDVRQESVVINLLKDIISNYKVIVTSRPYADLTHICRHADQVLEIQGFDENNVRKYIKNVLKSGSKLKSNDETKILEFRSSLVISDMMSVPILLDIFLFAWEQIEVTQTSKLTITKLYELIVLKLWNEFIQLDMPHRAKTFSYDSQNLKSVIEGPVSDESFALSKLAHMCFERGDLLFAYSEIDGNNDCKDGLVRTRFLNGVDADEENTEWKRYEFIHLTLCEFFTALNCVFHKSLEGFKKTVAKYKYNVTYRIIFGFICGLISNGTHGFQYTKEEKMIDKEEMLNIFFDCLDSEPIDMVRGYHNVLTVACLNECADNLKVKRTTEICKDLCDTHHQPVPMITSLAVIQTLVKNKINLSKYTQCRLPNLTDNFFAQSGFADIDAWSQINILGSQVSFNEASKRKLRELLVDKNKGSIFNFFSHNCRRIPDFFLIYILEQFRSSNEEIIIHRLIDIKMTLEDSKNVCAFIVPTVSVTDSIPDILQKIIKAVQVKIVYMTFLRNVYEFTESFREMLPKLFNEELSDVEISRIVYIIAFFNISSPTVLNQLMKIFENFESLRPLIVRAIFHLYYNKWLPYPVAAYLTQYLQIDDEDCESNKDHYKNTFIDDWRKYLVFFRSDVLMASTLYALVCEGLAHLNFQPKLLNNVIDRLCNGAQFLDDDMSYLLSRRKLTTDQIAKCIESDKIEFKVKYQLLSSQTHNRNVTAFLARNASDMFLVDNTSELYSRIEKDFTESERQTVVRYSAGYEFYHTKCISFTLAQVTEKIVEMNQQQQKVFQACKTYCSDLCFNTFQETVNGISFEKLSQICQSAFMLTYLSLNQRATYVTDEVLILSLNQSAKDIKDMILSFWNYETPGSVLDQRFFDNLADDVFGHYYFKILRDAIHVGVVSRASLIKWISPVNIKHLLTFLMDEINRFRYALYILSSTPSRYRLCCSNVQSLELGIEDIKLVYEFRFIVQHLDHSCRQVRKNAISDTHTMDKCNNFYTKVKKIDKLDEISDKQYKTNRQLVQFFDGAHARNFIELLKMLYAQRILIANSQDFDMLWSTFYTYYFRGSVDRFANFGPFHIDLSGISITDTNIVHPFNPNLVKFLGDNENNVHVLVLSNNHITVVGFEYLIKSAKKYKVKHLFLDGNHIYFDQQQFHAFKTLITDPNLELLTLDLSSNFIAAQWIEELNSLNSEDFVNACSVKYSLINNCRVIYERNLTDSHVGFSPAIDLIVETESKEVPLRITQKYGCVGYVIKKQRFGYSGHVLIFIERMVNGQREFQTAELFQGRRVKNLCKVVIREVDPFVDHEINDTCRESLKNRLLFYNIPKTGPFLNEIIEKLLEDIKDSQDKDNFYQYNISTKNEFENRNNCIKWANDIMKPLLSFEIIQEEIPWFYRSSSRNFVFNILGLIAFMILSKILFK